MDAAKFDKCPCPRIPWGSVVGVAEVWLLTLKGKLTHKLTGLYSKTPCVTSLYRGIPS